MLSAAEQDFVRRMCESVDQIPALKSLIINQSGTNSVAFNGVTGKLPYTRLAGIPANGDWTAFPFASGWADLNSPNACAYRIDAYGVVYLRGAASPSSGYTYGGSHATIGTLPAGYRPAQSANHVVVGHNSGDGLEYARWLNITTAGVVQIQSALGGLDNTASGNWWTLDCSFFST